MLIRSIVKSLAFVLSKAYFRVQIIGSENIPKKGGFILASNHISNLDPIVLAAVCFRELSFIAKDSLFKNPVARWLLLNLGAFPIKRDSLDVGAIKETIDKLRLGEAILMFPQGTRKDFNPLDQPKAGVAMIAQKADVPILPAFIKGTDLAMPRGGKLIKPVKVSVVFGKKIFIEGGQAYEQAASEVMRHIGRLAGN